MFAIRLLFGKSNIGTDIVGSSFLFYSSVTLLLLGDTCVGSHKSPYFVRPSLSNIYIIYFAKERIALAAGQLLLHSGAFPLYPQSSRRHRLWCRTRSTSHRVLACPLWLQTSFMSLSLDCHLASRLPRCISKYHCYILEKAD